MQDLGKAIAAVIAVMILTPGCLGSNPVTPTRFYLLNPVPFDGPAMAARNDGSALAVEIRSLRLPPYLEKPQIVTRSSQNRLELAEYHQWAGNLKKNMARVMVQNLSFLLSTPQVTLAPFHSGARPDVRVDAEVMAFEADASGQVALRVHWRLIDGRSGRMLATRISGVNRPVTGSGSEMENIVAAMNQSLGDFCRDLALAVAAELGSAD